MKTHETYDYVPEPLAFLSTHIKRGTPAVATFTREVSTINNLKANMLLGMNAMDPEGFGIVNSNSYVDINSCQVRVPMDIEDHSRPVKARVLSAQHTVVPPHQSYTYLSTTRIIRSASRFDVHTDVHPSHVIVGSKRIGMSRRWLSSATKAKAFRRLRSGGT